MVSVPECCLASLHHRLWVSRCGDLAGATVRARVRACRGSGGRGRSAGSARSGRNDSGARPAGRASTPCPRGRSAPQCCRGTDTSPSIPSTVLHPCSSSSSSSTRRRKRGLRSRSSNCRAACLGRVRRAPAGVSRRPALESAAADTRPCARQAPMTGPRGSSEAHLGGLLSVERRHPPWRAGGTCTVPFRAEDGAVGGSPPSRRSRTHLAGAISTAGFRS